MQNLAWIRDLCQALANYLGGGQIVAIIAAIVAAISSLAGLIYKSRIAEKFSLHKSIKREGLTDSSIRDKLSLIKSLNTVGLADITVRGDWSNLPKLGKYKRIRFRAMSGSTFVNQHLKDFEEAFKNHAKVEVILAQAGSDLIKVQGILEHGDVVEGKDRAALIEKELVDVEKRLRDCAKIAGVQGDRLQIRYDSPSYRMNLIIYGDENAWQYVWTSISLPPTLARQSEGLLWDKDSPMLKDCVRHFDEVWKIASPSTKLDAATA